MEIKFILYLAVGQSSSAREKRFKYIHICVCAALNSRVFSRREFLQKEEKKKKKKEKKKMFNG